MGPAARIPIPMLQDKPARVMEEWAPFAYQAAGHPGTLLVSPDTTLVAKPLVQKELAFYHHVATLSARGPFPLGVFLPTFHGTAVYNNKHYLVLDNIIKDLNRPCLLDLKIGYRTFEADASPSKRADMEAKDRSTTSHELGLRISGLLYWQNDAPVKASKEACKRMSKNKRSLKEHLSRFFGDAALRAIFLQQLELLKKAIILSSIVLCSSSILVAYGTAEQGLCLRLVDFAHSHWAEGDLDPAWSMYSVESNILQPLYNLEEILGD